MLFRDDAAIPFSPQKAGDSGRQRNRARHRAGLAEDGQQARATHALAEVTCSNERPFYSRPSQRNRRVQPFQKWLIAAGFLMAAVLGYLLGLSHRLPASWLDLPQKDFASSSAIKSKAELVPLRGGIYSMGDPLGELKEAPPHQVILAPFMVAKLQATSEVELVALKGGSYSMGDSLGELKDARPHQVTLAPFMIAKHEVALELWDSVMLWGRDHGYPDLPAGNGKAHNHPVYGISWGEAVKWCNALSEKEGLTPCYYTEANKQKVARTGKLNMGNQHVNWAANGYRLPTEAEWEFAARGGLADKRFPLGNEITHEHANYHGSPRIEYDKSQREGIIPALMSSKPYTAVVGSFQPNGFGLHDMAGNVFEWCWDFYDPSYGTPESQLKNPHGPDKGQNCVVRGGSWRHTAAEARCASRFSLPGDLPAAHVGFRVVRCR